MIYAITARSDKSKKRVLVKESGNVITRSLDKEEDELLIYQASIKTNQGMLLGNGNHIKEMKPFLDNGESLLSSLTEIEPEPDSYSTPRIALLINSDSSYEIGIVSKEEEKVSRKVWKYQITPGFGHIIHTYDGNKEFPSSFSLDPVVIDLEKSLSSFINKFWSSLDSEYRVALYALYDGAEKFINERNSK